MKEIKWKSITLRDVEGNAFSSEHLPAGASVEVRQEPICGGRGLALYLDAILPAGFAAEESIVLTPDIPDTGDYLSIAYHSEFWCRPQWGASFADLHKHTHEVLIRRAKDDYVCYLVLVGDTFKTFLRGSEAGLELNTFPGCDGLTACANQPMIVALEGNNPTTLLREIAAAVPGVLGNGMKMRNEREVSPIFDLFGWCSWDAFQYHVSHEGLVRKAREFAEKKVPVGFAIIDDMWADAPHLNEIPLDSPEKGRSMLRNFAGDPVRFPKGMANAISDLKQEGIPHVGIWFPTTGYWSGLDPEGDEAKKQGDRMIQSKGQKNRLVVAPEHEKAEGMFDDYCGRVKSWGSDFVKIDNQSNYYWYSGMVPVGTFGREIQPVIDRMALKHFDGAIINCMCMASENMYNRRDTAICRCSDDFIPESPKWFAKNILQCSYNGLLQGQFYVNDWDMWWTDDEQAKKNSLCRAISGGPIYVSDKVGRTRPEILRPLMLRDGRILRADESAHPTEDCFFENPTLSERIFKIRNRFGTAGVVAVFNINAEGKPVKGTLAPAEAGIPEGDYAYYEYFTRTAGILKAGETVGIELPTNSDFRLYTFVPLADVTLMGRTDLFMGVKAAHLEGGRVTLMEGGEVSFVSRTPIRVTAAGRELPVTASGVLHTVTVPENVAELTVEKL